MANLRVKFEALTSPHLDPAYNSARWLRDALRRVGDVFRSPGTRHLSHGGYDMALLNRWGIAAAAAASIAIVSTKVVAQEKVDQGFAGLPAAAVKARQDFMRAQAADTKSIRDYAKGMAAKAEAEKAIADLQLRNGAILKQLVPGTSSADLPGVSFAKPAAFTDKVKLEAIIANLKSIEDRTAAVIKTGTPEEVGVAGAEIGRVGCAACHNTYRERRSA